MGLIMRSKTLRLFTVLALAGFVSACSNTPMQVSPRSVSSTSAGDINEMLDADIAKYDKALPKKLPDNVASALLPLLSATPAKQVQETRFDIAVKDVNARDFFRSLVQGTNYNMVVHPDVKGKISLELKNVTVPQVMSLTKELYGYDFQGNGNLYRVMPGGLRTKIFQINYLNVKRMGASETRVSSGSVSEGSNSSDDSGGSNNSGSSDSTTDKVIGTRISTTSENNFWSQLSQTLMLIAGGGEGRKVVVTPNAGMVVVRAMSDELLSVENYLRQTELIMKRQVVLEAKILEVELNESYQQGIDWTAIETSSSIGADGLPKKLVGGNMGSDLITNDLGGVFTATLKIGDFSGFMQLLSTQGSVQVLSSPRISTVNNQKAIIKVGTDEFFVTDIDIDEDTGSSSNTDSTSTDVTLTPFFSGIALDVTPQISAEGDIILHVHPTISDVEDQEKTISLGSDEVILPLALSTIRETDSVIRAENGQIVVIGGLIQNITQEKNSTVPILGDIPWLGELFKQKRYVNKKSELVILLRPLISKDKVFEDEIRRSRKRFGEFKDILDTPNSSVF